MGALVWLSVPATQGSGGGGGGGRGGGAGHRILPHPGEVREDPRDHEEGGVAGGPSAARGGRLGPQAKIDDYIKILLKAWGVVTSWWKIIIVGKI